MKRICLALVLVVSLAVPAWADFQDGVAAYDRGDYATALQEFKPLAEQGDARAQNSLGLMYYHGQGVPQDDAEAVRLYSLAAEQGYAWAQYHLGLMYANGEGVLRDYVQAHMWSNLAASRWPPGEERDDAVRNRDIAAAKMTPAQVAEAQRLAREWEPR